MTTVNISPEVALQEERALSAALKNRNLILAQAVSDLKADLAQCQEENAALKDELANPRIGGEG